MTKRVYKVHLLIETDQESDTLVKQVSEWASNEEAFSGHVLLDISQIRKAHVELDTFSAMIARFTHKQEDIVVALGKATTINEQYTAVLGKITSALTSLVKEAEEKPHGDRFWSWGPGASPEKLVDPEIAYKATKDETAADKEAEDETAVEDETPNEADKEAKDETPNEI